jgi:uncharacterized protein
MLIETSTAADFIDIALQNPFNRAILDRLPGLGLKDSWLVAGSLFETVWNIRSGRPARENIADYDLFYFDGSDTSYEAEDTHIRRLPGVFGDLAATVELKNQARVHLWYEDRFGQPYSELRSSRDGIGRFLVAGTCIGLQRNGGGFQLYAPYGLEDAWNGILRPNLRIGPPELFRAKAEKYRARWPWLTVVDG